MDTRDRAHEILEQVKHLEEGDVLEISDVRILSIPYTLTFKQPEPGRITSWLGLPLKLSVCVTFPNGRERSFWFDPTGPAHDATDQLRGALFEIHRELYSSID